MTSQEKEDGMTDRPTGIHQAIGALASMASRDPHAQSDDWERACSLLSILTGLSPEEQEQLHDIVFAMHAEPPDPTEERAATAWMAMMDLAYAWLNEHRDFIAEDAKRGCPASQDMLQAMNELDNAETDMEFAHIVAHAEQGDS